MNLRRYSSLLAVIFLFAFAQPAFANSIAPTAYFWPGVLPLALGLALPASVLAAFLERPFVTAAGVREHVLWFSLQANLVSLVIGYVTLPVGVFAIYTIGPLWSLIAVAMSVASEGWYYQWRAIKGAGNLRWGYVVSGNVFSSFILLLLPYVALEIKQARPDWVWKLDRYQDALFWGSVGGSVFVFVLSLFLPGLQQRIRTVPNQALQQTGHAKDGSSRLGATPA